jgi:hypothetical protein
MLTLTARISLYVGCSRRRRTQLRRLISVLVEQHLKTARDTASSAGEESSGLRDRVLAAVWAELVSRHEPTQLADAVWRAILLDELAYLPPQQRQVLTPAVTGSAAVAAISAATGYTPWQVTQGMRAALITITNSTRQVIDRLFDGGKDIRSHSRSADTVTSRHS